jgi:hypothetical protein
MEQKISLMGMVVMELSFLYVKMDTLYSELLIARILKKGGLG